MWIINLKSLTLENVQNRNLILKHIDNFIFLSRGNLIKF